MEHAYSHESGSYRIEPEQRRLHRVTLAPEPVGEFLKSARLSSIRLGLDRAYEFVPFERFRVARLLEEQLGNGFASRLISILADWQAGAFVLRFPETAQVEEDQLIMQAALMYSIGLPRQNRNGADFVMSNQSASDPLLSNPWQSIPLHTGGTFSRGATQWLMLLKMAEQHAIKGENILLHLNDWNALSRFSSHPLAVKNFAFRSPSPESCVTSGPIFFRVERKLLFRFPFMNVYPESHEEAHYLQEIADSLSEEDKISVVPLRPAELYCINSGWWLHGRNAFEPAGQKLFQKLCTASGMLWG